MWKKFIFSISNKNDYYYFLDLLKVRTAFHRIQYLFSISTWLNILLYSIFKFLLKF